MTYSLRTGLFVIGICAALASGCSESHTGDLVDSGGGTLDLGLTGTDGGPPRDTGTTVLVDMGPPDPAVDSGPPDPGTDSGLIMMTDAGPPDPGTDSGTVVMSDAGPGGVTCGTDTCVDPEICCVMFGGGMATMTCGAPADCMGVAASCDGPEDCATGEACCGMGGPGGGGTTGCVADSMCGFGRLCHADADCTGMDTCCSFMGASICSRFCP